MFYAVLRAEMAPMMEIENWLGEDRLAAAVGTGLQEYGSVSTSSSLFQYALQTTSSLTTSAAERTYSAYADEPLTATQDTIASTESWLHSRRH
jgi:hypothetical protein